MLRMLLSPNGCTLTLPSTVCWSMPPPRRRAACWAARGEATSAAAVWTVRVGSPESRTNVVPRKVRSSCGSGVDQQLCAAREGWCAGCQERHGDRYRGERRDGDDQAAGADRPDIRTKRCRALVRPGRGDGHQWGRRVRALGIWSTARILVTMRSDGRMGVVTLVDRLVHGGAERLAAEIATRLDPERFESTLCVSRWSDPGHAAAPEVPERLLAAAEAAGVRFLGLSRRGRWDIAAWGPLVRLLRSGHVQVMHGHMFGSNVWAVLLGRLTGVPVVVAHEHSWAFTGARSRQFVDKHVIGRGSDVVIACSQEDRRRMIEVEGIAAGQRAVRAERHRGAPTDPRARACGASWGSVQRRRWSAASEPCVPRSASTCSCARPGSFCRDGLDCG